MMSKWYVRDLSKLTGVSVQTLHHYDRIGLLKPSLRMSNGYRVYSEADLLRLQKIIALKFFGFELLQIKELISGESEPMDHFLMQAKILENKAHAFLEASKALKSIIGQVSDDKSIDWEIIIKLIEVYNMTQKLEKSWVSEIFTPEELKQYAAFETQWESAQMLEKKAQAKKDWADLVREIHQNLARDPRSEIGVQIGEKCMTWLNRVYGKKYAHLRSKKFEQGFGEGKGLDEALLTPKIVSWLDGAIDTYWRNRLGGILNQIGTGVSDEVIFNLWKDALDDMYGEDDSRKKEIYELALANPEVSEQAKEWLKVLRELTAANRHLL